MSYGIINKAVPAIVTYHGSRSNTIEVTVDNCKRTISAELLDSVCDKKEDKIIYFELPEYVIESGYIDEKDLEILRSSDNNKIVYDGFYYSLASDGNNEVVYTGISDDKLKSVTINKSIFKVTLNEQIVDIIAGKGLYYDAASQVLTQPFWYITSELNEDHQGTPGERVQVDEQHPFGFEYIISGPYNLSSGGSSDLPVIITNPEQGQVLIYDAANYSWINVSLADEQSIIYLTNAGLSIKGYETASQGQMLVKDAANGIAWIDPLSTAQLDAAVAAAESAAITATNAATNANSSAVRSKAAADTAEIINTRTMDWVNNKFWWGTLEEYNALPEIIEGAFYFIQV